MAVDPSSFANVADVRVAHLHLQLNADFNAHTLSGQAELTLEGLSDAGVTRVVLDTKRLNIASICDMNGQPVTYAYADAAEDDVFGRALNIDLAQSLSKGAQTKIVVTYATSAEASAIQWLPPAQTSGKVHPYLFTQCQAIHCRSLAPVQDSPHNKFTYTAQLTVPAPLVALMSAHRQPELTQLSGDTITYHFKQPVCMPSYLLAFAIGALESRSIGPRSSVWSERETVEAGAHEFAETEAFLTAAEDVCGPYVWGNYDVLLLPPSFPYGGMENPQLTFVTPTLLAGDRSLAGVVAHEIAHSWMGNLVTCSTWESFWLNEGFTVFVERKIEQRLYGKPYAQLKAIIGRKSLLTAVNAYGCAHAHTCLHLPLDTKTDPDDAYSTIAYEKGFNLLCHLEQLMGGEVVMDKYLKAHVQQFAHKSLSSAEWVKFFIDYCRHNGVDMSAIDALDWNAWLHTPGMPKEFQFDTSLADNSNALAQKWSVALQSGSFEAFAAADLIGWKSPQTVVFLEGLEDVQTAFFANNGTKEAFRALLLQMDSLYNLTTVQNAEIRFHWQLLCLRSEWDMIYPHVVAFATGQGRMKFTRPLYKELNKVAPALAQATFAANKQNYHSICAKMVARDLGM